MLVVLVSLNAVGLGVVGLRFWMSGRAKKVHRQNMGSVVPDYNNTIVAAVAPTILICTVHCSVSLGTLRMFDRRHAPPPTFC